jgi:predicted nucleotidyltransferase
MLDEMANRLVAEFDPEAIILFGSHAWGTPKEESVVDLMVVVPDSTERPVDRSICAYRCLEGLGVSKDVLIRMRHEFDRFASVHASLEAEVQERGKVIYERTSRLTGIA